MELRPLSPPRPPSVKDPRGPSTGSAILDTYLQFIAENSAGLHLSAEQAAKMAAKMSEEQRRLESHHRLLDGRDDFSGGEDDEYSEEEEIEDEEREPESIKAE